MLKRITTAKPAKPDIEKSQLSEIGNTAEQERIGAFRRTARMVIEKVSEPKNLLKLAAIPIAISFASIAYTAIAHKYNVLGAEAGISTCAIYLPQAIKAIKTKSTHDISMLTQTLMIGTSALWIGYGLQIGSAAVWGSESALAASNVAIAAVKIKDVIKNDQNAKRTLMLGVLPLAVAFGGVAYAAAANNPAVAGTEAAIISVGMQLPQTVRSIKTHSTRDMSIGTLSLDLAATSAWVAYGLMLHLPPLWLSQSASVAQISAISAIKVKETVAEINTSSNNVAPGSTA